MFFFSLKNLGLQLIANTVQRFPHHTNTRTASTSTLSTFGMWLHHHTEDRVIGTVDTGNVRGTARCGNLFRGAKAIVVLTGERRFPRHG